MTPKGFTKDQIAEITAASDAVNRAMKPLEDAFMQYVEFCKEVGYGRMVQLLERKLGWGERGELIRRINRQERALDVAINKYPGSCFCTRGETCDYCEWANSIDAILGEEK